MARLVSRAMGDCVYWSDMRLRCSMMYWSSVMCWSLVVDWGSMMRSGFVMNGGCVVGRCCVVGRSCVMGWSFVVSWSIMVGRSRVFFMGSDTMSMSFLKRALVVSRCLVMSWFALLFSGDQMVRCALMSGSSVVDRYGMMRRGWVVRVGDMSDFLMDEAVVAVMRITDMSHWSMSLGDMMINMRSLNMMCLGSMGSLMEMSFVVLIMLFLLSKHQVVNWLIMIDSNWL